MTPRRLLPVSIALLAVAGLGAGPAQARRTKLTVTPANGRSSTTFTVSFAAPERVYGSGSDEYERYRVTLMPPKRCDTFPVTAKTRGPFDIGDRVTLRARAPKRGFCAGEWRGKVMYEESVADVEEDCSAADQPGSGSSQCEESATGTYSKLRLPVGSFRVRVR
jgi:hypothetical protein